MLILGRIASFAGSPAERMVRAVSVSRTTAREVGIRGDGSVSVGGTGASVADRPSWGVLCRGADALDGCVADSGAQAVPGVLFDSSRRAQGLRTARGTVAAGAL